MASYDYSSTARALATQIDDDDDEDTILPVRHSQPSPIWSRRSLDSSRASPHQRPRTTRDKWAQEAYKLQRRGVKLWLHFTPLQRAGIVTLNVCLLVLAILFLIYNERIFAWLAPAAKRWRDLPGGWLILWFATFFVSFPPMIGYSTLVTIAGFVFGMYGWLIIASATIFGSTASFIVSRTLLKNYVERMTEKSQKFAALSLVLKHDGLKLLCMIRLCPLPYSFANGAISTIPTVTWPNFMLATAIASPKLLLHIFIGSRLGALAKGGDKMDTRTKIVSYVTIAVGMIVGVGTGYLIYVRTKARAKVLEAEEAAAANSNGGRRRSGEAGSGYIDDPAEREAVDILRRDDDISLHDDMERGYRDEFTDDEDASERDVFDIGDGEDEDDDEPSRKGEA